MDQTIIELPALLFAIHDDGTLRHLGTWVRDMLVTDELLARADGRRVILGDGALTFRCTNGGARYLLSASTIAGAYHAQLADAWS